MTHVWLSQLWWHWWDILQQWPLCRWMTGKWSQGTKPDLWVYGTSVWPASCGRWTTGVVLVLKQIPFSYSSSSALNLLLLKQMFSCLCLCLKVFVTKIRSGVDVFDQLGCCFVSSLCHWLVCGCCFCFDVYVVCFIGGGGECLLFCLCLGGKLVLAIQSFVFSSGTLFATVTLMNVSWW